MTHSSLNGPERSPKELMWLDVLPSTRAAQIQVNRMMSMSPSPPVFYAPVWIAAQASDEEGTRVTITPQLYRKQMFQSQMPLPGASATLA